MTTASADFAPCFKLKKKKKPLPAMFQGQRLTASLQAAVDAVLERFCNADGSLNLEKFEEAKKR